MHKKFPEVFLCTFAAQIILNMELTLDNLVSKSLDLYLKYGIRSITMDDVARELAVSKKTVYQLVNDKDDLLTKCIELKFLQSDISVCDTDKHLNVIEKHVFMYNKLSNLLLELNPSFEYDLKKYYPKQYSSFIKNRRKIIYKKMQDDLVQGIKEGYFREDLDIPKLAILNIINVEALRTTDVLKEYDLRMIDIIKELFNYHLHAIATPLGLEAFKKLQTQQSTI